MAIARALINNPDVILADEPTGNLDSKTGKSNVELLLNLTKKGKTIKIVTHDPRIAKMVAEHPSGKNIWINDGRLIDTPEDGITDRSNTNLTDMEQNESVGMKVQGKKEEEKPKKKK